MKKHVPAEDSAKKAFLEFFGSISMILMNFPATRAIGLVGGLLAKVLPRGFEVFRQVVGIDKVKMVEVPQPTKVQVLTFFERYKALREAFEDYFPQEGETMESSDYRFLREAYVDIIYSLSFEDLKEAYPYVDSRFLRAQVKRNEKFLQEVMADLVTQIKGKTDFLESETFLGMTIEDITNSVKGLANVDISSKSIRERLVGRLKAYWPPKEVSKFMKEDGE